MKQTTISLQTDGRGVYDVSRHVQDFVAESSVLTGLCNVFIRHTSASLMICENADPDVMRDLETFLSRIAPDGDPANTHVAEGPDDMPAHIRTVLSGVTLSIPVMEGHLALGTWQGIYLWEHRDAPHTRTIAAHLLYE